MAYRDDTGDALEAPTAQGTLRIEIAPRQTKLSIADRTLLISERFATVVEHHKKRTARDKRTSIELTGRLVVARDVPREDLGVWLEVEPGTPRAGMRRIFGVEPLSLMEPTGLDALAALDRLAHRLRAEVLALSRDIRRAVEIGSSAVRGLDKVLIADHGDRIVVYARRLFRDRARAAMSIHEDGRISVPDGKKLKEIRVHSRFGVTVWGDYIRFADPQGTDLARVSIPWIAPEDRKELARRIGQLVDHDEQGVIAWPPRLAAEADQPG
ncbi:MAG: hypothetical protein H0T42_30755 [Deltaproteobacteria bacterium]|nr:hypothetical protein [Deltaproteobacteria bacterium]